MSKRRCLELIIPWSSPYKRVRRNIFVTARAEKERAGGEEMRSHTVEFYYNLKEMKNIWCMYIHETTPNLQIV